MLPRSIRARRLAVRDLLNVTARCRASETRAPLARPSSNALVPARCASTEATPEATPSAEAVLAREALKVGGLGKPEESSRRGLNNFSRSGSGTAVPDSVRADIDQFFDGRGNNATQKKLEDPSTTANWTSQHYTHYLQRIVASTTKNAVWADQIWTRMKSTGVQPMPEFLLTLAQVYADQDSSRQSQREAAESQLDSLREKSEKGAEGTAGLILRTEKKVQELLDPRLLDPLEEVVGLGLKDYEKEIGASLLTLIFRVLGRRRDVSRVEDWIKVVGNLSLKPQAGTYAAIIEVYGATGDLYQAQKWYENFTKSSVSRREEGYVAFAAALTAAGRYAAAQDILENVVPKAATVSMATRSALARLFVLSGNIEGAKQLLDEIGKDHSSGRQHGHLVSQLLEPAVKEGHLEIAGKIVALLENDHLAVRRHAQLLSNYAVLCLQKDDIETGLKVFHMICAAAFNPSPPFTRALVTSLKAANREADIVDLFERALVAYGDNPALQARQSRHTLAMAITKLRHSDVRLLLKVHRVGMVDRHTALYSHSAQALTYTYDEAVRQQKEPKLSVTDFETLFHALFHSSFRNYEFGIRLLRYLDDMKRLGIAPNQTICDMGVTSLPRRTPPMPDYAIKWNQAMSELGLNAPEVTPEQAQAVLMPHETQRLDSQIKQHLRGNRIDEAVELMKYLYERSKAPQLSTIAELLKATANDLGSAAKVVEMTLEYASKCQEGTRHAFEDTVAQTIALTFMSRNGRVNQVSAIMAEMATKFGRNPYQAKHFTRFFNYAAAQQTLGESEWANIEKVFEEYKTIEKTLHTTLEKQFAEEVYIALVSMYQRAGKHTQVEQTFAQLKRLGLPLRDTVYAGMISHYSRISNDLSAAEQLFEEYVDEHWDKTLSLPPFSAIVEAYSAAGDLPEALRVMKLAESKGLHMAADTFALIISGLARKEGTTLPDLLAVKTMMVQKNLPPNEDVFEALIAFACRHGDLDAADQLYEEMTRVRRLGVSTGTYEVLVGAFTQAGKSVSAMKFRAAFDATKRRPTTPLENAALTLLLAHQTADGYTAAKAYYTAKMPPHLRNTETFTLIIDAAVRNADVEFASGVLHTMQGWAGVQAADVDKWREVVARARGA
ncbi:uncharacterized protein EV422DRAFT_536675 [Fimicolochytrium jonesii]|uniref:uncharacterized protein n=1 Tax=Fimicolochytrium jonesii TaxID=1396493 RepID=UPI0022FF151D|nr:uncharacterized protein EV422DRAFT_536675 [Fimicolochytrium jonesii]KAI8818749.1 hypothetical protein EV422DRAFT_536675 [Fimicolochytrium jonesii]